ncbi:MAG: hypothetical protein ACLR4M_07375, partial [Blautia sp.]
LLNSFQICTYLSFCLSNGLFPACSQTYGYCLTKLVIRPAYFDKKLQRPPENDKISGGLLNQSVWFSLDKREFF